MKLSALLPTVGIFGQTNADTIDVSGICDHTEKLKKGMLFIVKKGRRTDATRLLDTIEKKGASALLIDRKTPLPRETRLPCYYADDITVAEAKIWERYYNDPAREMRLIGVTGTNGKTSTAEFLAQLIGASGIRTAYMGTLGTHLDDIVIEEGEDTMTTPTVETLYRRLRKLADLGAKAVVMELSSHAATQGRVKLLHFESLLFTNLTEDHLDYHQNMESYYLAKRSLFAQADLAIINKDDAYGARLLSELNIPTYSVAVIESADYTVNELHENGCKSTQYLCVSASESIAVSYPFFGSFHVYNTMLAVVAALAFGVSAEEIRRKIPTLQPPRGRLEALPTEKDYAVIIDYAHTPDAMELALKAVKRNTKGRVFAVFGAGGDREREKRPVMGEIATRLAFHVFITTDNPRHEPPKQIFADIVSGIREKSNYTVIEDRADAIRAALAAARPGDSVLLLGKGHEEYLIVGDEKRFFSEREIVHEYLHRKG